MIRLLLVLCFLGTSVQAQVRAVDGDNVKIGNTSYRLQGVDAPELETRAGQEAKRWMVYFIRDKHIECVPTGDMTYNRPVAVCFADGQDIGATVIAAGHALDCQKFSGGRYRHLETPAAKSRLKRAGYCK